MSETKQELWGISIDFDQMLLDAHTEGSGTYVFDLFIGVTPHVHATWLTPPEPSEICEISISGPHSEYLSKQVLDLLWEMEEDLLCEMQKKLNSQY